MPEADNIKKLSVIHTPCKECVFATYDNNTQNGCSIGMIDKFKNAGYEILEVYDNEKEFFVINDKKCIFMRPHTWLEKTQCQNIEEARVLATTENNIKYILILDIDDNTTLESIQNTIGCFQTQNITPIGILVMTDQSHKLKVEIKQIAQLLNKQNIKWRIQKFIDQDMSFSQKIKAIVQSAPVNRYYFYVNPININADSIDIANLNNKILDGLVFGCLSMGGGLFFSYLSWQYAKLNNNIDIISDSTFHLNYEDI